MENAGALTLSGRMPKGEGRGRKPDLSEEQAKFVRLALVEYMGRFPNQSEPADRLGVSQQHLSALAKGRHAGGKAASKALALRLGELLGRNLLAEPESGKRPVTGVAAGVVPAIQGQAMGALIFSPWIEAMNKTVVEQNPAQRFTYSQQTAAKIFIHVQHAEMAPSAKRDRAYLKVLKAAKWLDEHGHEPSPAAILLELAEPEADPVVTPELEEARKQNEADNIPKATRRPR